jgi:thymidylate synthase
MSTKKSKKEIVVTKDAVLRVEWANKTTPRMRRIDQRQIDKYLLDGKVNNSQHQAANWYHNLASTASATPHLTSQIGKLRVGSSKPVITNKQAEARVVMGKVDEFIKSNTDKQCLSVMRNVIIYDESMREQQRKYGGKVRTEGLIMLRDALDALDKIMGKYSRYL